MRDSNGNILKETDSTLDAATPYYYLTDALGTPWKMLDTSGAVVWSAAYKAFGEAAVLVNTIDQPLRFPGQYFDSESGLHYNLNRYYDPDTGRYLSVDPVVERSGGRVLRYSAFEPQFLSPYGYAGNNPLLYTDEDGAFPFPLVTGAIGGVAGGLGSLGAQLLGNEPVSWGKVGTAFGVGFAAGVAAPFVATSWLGAALLGGTANLTQYGLDVALNDECGSVKGAGRAFGFGIAGGLLAGPLRPPNGLRFDSNTLWSSRDLFRRINNRQDTRAVFGSNLIRTFGGGYVANQ